MFATMPAPSQVLGSLAILLGLSASFLAPQITVIFIIAYCMIVMASLPYVMFRYGLRGVRVVTRLPRIVRLMPR
jgi:hypothetical protein